MTRRFYVWLGSILLVAAAAIIGSRMPPSSERVQSYLGYNLSSNDVKSVTVSYNSTFFLQPQPLYPTTPTNERTIAKLVNLINSSTVSGYMFNTYEMTFEPPSFTLTTTHGRIDLSVAYEAIPTNVPHEGVRLHNIKNFVVIGLDNEHSTPLLVYSPQLANWVDSGWQQIEQFKPRKRT